jgi:DNA-binding NtrC family response regulator
VENRSVLLINFHSGHSAALADAFRRNGLEVVIVESPAQARYEIGMGRCGVFVTCPLVADIITADLIDQFKRNCPVGLVVCVTDSRTSRALLAQADLEIPDTDDPETVARSLAARTNSNVA